MRISLRRGAVVATLGLLGWASSARAQCTKDTECKGDRICNEGVCMDPPASRQALAPPGPTFVIGADSAPAPPSSGAIPDSGSLPAQSFVPATEPHDRTMATIGLVLTAMGAATLVTTVILLVKGAAEHRASLNAFCDNDVCSAAADAQNSAGEALLTAGTVTGLATIALLGPGIPLFFLGRHQLPARSQTTAWWVPQRVSTYLHQVTLTYAY
jgi:hypothetical protein